MSFDSAQKLFAAGYQAHQRGDHADAEFNYRDVLKAVPSHQDALNLLAAICQSRGDLDQAENFLNKAITVAPSEPVFLGNRATLLEAGSFFDERVIRDLERCTQLQPLSASHYGSLARALDRRRYTELANIMAARALTIDPSVVANLENQAELMFCCGKRSEAWRFFVRAASLDPRSLSALLGLARCELFFDAFDECRDLLWRVLCVSPSDVRIAQLVTVLLQRRYSVVDGGALYTVVRAGLIETAAQWMQLATLYEDFHYREEAVACYRRAMVLQPGNLDLSVNLGLCELQLGRFREGWADQERRLLSAAALSRRFLYGLIQESRPTFTGPSAGSVDKRVLVWAEQGVGDEVMFGGLVGEFRGLCGELLLQVDRRLMGLFERALPGVRVFERGKTVPAELYDEQIPMGSLGKWLRPSRESFEGKGGRYLQAQEGLGRRLRAELGVGASEKLIGLSWRSASAETGAARSLSLKELVGALQGVEGVRFLNLQYGEVSEELRALREETGVEVLTHPGIDNREDLEGLAGLIEGCDLVVSVGNATAHLSGALGQKTWVLLPYVAGWRWLHEGERCPWYRSVRLFRQAERDRWQSVLEALGGHLPLLWQTNIE
jgi:tetratricopeptide (TPR) repeat protein